MPFSDASDIWMHSSNYDPCQQLEEAARAEKIELIRYASVRDPAHKPNAAILTCTAFAATAPTEHQTWRLWFNKAGVHAICEFRGEKFSVTPDVWSSDTRLGALTWQN